MRLPCTTALLTTAITLVFGACSPRLTVLDSTVRDENSWTEQELGRIQFYLSEDLVLTRERQSGSTAIVEGKVKVKDGRKVEELVFERGTPGVVLFQTDEGNLAIGFDARRDDRYLMFGPNPKQSSDYTLLGRSAGRYSATVTYDKQQWEVSMANADVRLLFDMRRSGTTKRNRQSVGGRKL